MLPSFLQLKEIEIFVQGINWFYFLVRLSQGHVIGIVLKVQGQG